MPNKKTFSFIAGIVLFVVQTGNAQQTGKLQLFFEVNSFELKESELQKIKQFALFQDTLFISSLNIYGFADDKGNKELNDSLSQKRANTVHFLLNQLGLASSFSSKPIGKGPVEIDSTLKRNPEEQRNYNRRVEIVYNFALIEKFVERAKPAKPQGKDILTPDKKVGDKIALENILFIGNRHTLLPESYPALENLTKILLSKTEYSIAILGHICCTPYGNDGIDAETGERNLSVSRAKAVYDYLVEHGIDEKRLTYKGLRGDYPTGKGDKFDRRVEIQITAIKRDKKNDH